jgi:GNAT superfamily N-acetyltransferase
MSPAAEALFALERRMARVAGDRFSELPAALLDQIEDYDRRRARAAERILVVARDDQGWPAALTAAHLAAGTALLEDVATLRRGRGRGLGSAAVRAAVSIVRERGARHVCLTAEPQVADGFYSRLGFETVAECVNCVLSSVPAEI